jgi:hypothetical protein
MNFSRTDVNPRPDLDSDAQRPRPGKQSRLERDIARGYSINVKQVVLAFAVEFWIIGLIILGTYLLIAEAESDHDHVSREAIFSALLLPAALAMVELARVPLAIAVRTQDAWQIKLVAAVGVLAAITVTSFSLSQLAWKTFDIRIAEATRAGGKLNEAMTKKDFFEHQRNQLQHDIDQKIHIRNSVNERLAALELQLTKISSSVGQSCKPILGQDGKPMATADGKPVQSCTPIATVNQPQLNALKTQIAGAKKELEFAEAAVKQAEDDMRKTDPHLIEEEVNRVQAEYRATVTKSQLHSYTAMITGKAVADVTEAEVKTLEKYLILIPCVAAAFASTLIAITAVRRIRPKPDGAVTMPDEAAAYLFGPLLEAIKMEARAPVSDVNARPKAKISTLS